MEIESSDAEGIELVDETAAATTTLVNQEENYKRHVLPDKSIRTWKDILLYVPLAVQNYFFRVSRILGWRFLVFIWTSQCLLKGLTYNVVASLALPLFKQVLNVSASRLQFLTLIIVLGWSIKPLLGLLSDLTLLCGYHKRYWLLISLGIGFTCAGLVFLAYNRQSPVGVALCLMGIQFQIAMFDLMSESSYSVVVRDHPYTGSDITTLVQGFQHSGAIVAALFVGLMAEHHLFYALFAISGTLCVVPIVPTMLGWLPEEQFPGGTRVLIDSKCGMIFQWVDVKQMKRDRGMIAVIAFTGISAPITALVANAADPAIALAVSVLLTAASLMGSFLVFPRIVFNIALYQVLTTLARPSLGSAMDYFYTADEDCVPGGPHFSMSFYIITAGLLGAIMTFCSVWIYNLGFSHLRFRTVLIVTTLLSGAIGTSDLFIVTRANIKLGLSDAASFIVGEAIFEPVLNMLNYIPAITLLSKVVPDGMESSCFAFLAGIGNFASMISELSGGLIFEAAGIRTISNPKCNFDNLWWLILICHASLPILIGLPASFLIPNVLQTEELQ
ncbi:MAG: folate/biopterin family MFS transporter [Nitrosomonas sp.]|nr:folate/biopterin family MFS transporter [Nitrosomonas sp.]